MDIRKILTNRNIFIVMIVLSVVSSLRSLLMPLGFDELTYSKLANSLLSGKYYLHDSPSTVTPIIPLLFALFKIKAYPILGFTIHKLVHVLLALLGGRYVYLVLKQLQLDKSIVLCLLAFVAVNPNAVAWFSNLYPEAVLFFSFWGFIYYTIKPPRKSHIAKLLGFFVLLVLTRYVYLVLGLVILYTYYDYVKVDFKKYKSTLFICSVLFALPVLFWGKYVLSVENDNENTSGVSYFKRFKTENKNGGMLYNIKCGLGLQKHHEVDKINGIPAFVTLFIPKTGFRNYVLSVILILAIIFGLLKKIELDEIKKIMLATMLIMLGLIFAGTGFSRYWVVLLPSFCLGFYYTFKNLKINDLYFIRFVQVLGVVYILNEIRVDALILNQVL